MRALCLLLLSAAPAAADVNDEACVPAAAHPLPVVLAHGRSGHVGDLAAITRALEADGFCVFGTDYGRVNGAGQTGMDHLAKSGAEIATFVDHVLSVTGASRVDVVGYSEGTGVLNDFILGKGGAAKVRRLVSFGGLHHPYAHASANGFADSDVFLPNLIAAARIINPNITAQQVITQALDLYAGAGGQLAGIDHEVATSPFASDLFEPTYWKQLHGGLSETPTTILRPLSSGHGVPTKDAAATVCYTNLVSPADPITGPSAGFQDPAPHVDNVMLQTTADHGGIITDAGAIAKLVAALGTPCAVSPDDPTPEPDPGTDDDDDTDDTEGGGGGGFGAGCATHGSTSFALVLLALVGLRCRKRR